MPMTPPDPSKIVPGQDQVAEATRVFLLHQRELTAYILAIVHDQHLAEDIRQEVWLVVVNRWDDYGALADPVPTMKVIARRQAMVALRRMRPRRAVPSDAALEVLASAMVEMDSEQEARRVALDHCLETLPDDWRQLINLRYRDGLAVTELAERLSRRADTVSMHLHRMRARLLRCIDGRLRQDGGA
jgi:RNA polymerase sigma-70 factor (ECF subfamily)